MTNESEAMEVWQEAKAVHDGCVSGDWNTPDQAAARVIATALEARDAELNDLRHWKLCAEEGLVERDARIAELEGALEPFAEQADFYDTCEQHPGGCPDDSLAGESPDLTVGNFRTARAILTRGNTHD